MRLSQCIGRTIALLLATLLSGSAVSGATPIAGIWRGESICATGTGSCHDESVIYYIKEIPNRSDLVLIRADKIVDGRPVTMGSGEWQYDGAQGTLVWRTARQTWQLKLIGTHLEGTLVLANGTLVRKMTLQKDK